MYLKCLAKLLESKEKYCIIVYMGTPVLVLYQYNLKAKNWRVID